MKMRYEKCLSKRVMKEPLQKINEKAIILDMNVKSIKNSINNKLNISKSSYSKLITKLDALSPLKTLTRGYNIAEKNGKVISKAVELNAGDEIKLKFIDGNRNAKII